MRAVEVSFGGKPVTNLRALLASCCTDAPAASLPKTNYYFPGDPRGRLLQAGKSVQLFAWPEARDDPRWARLEGARAKIHTRVCYCSVFNECYVRDSSSTEPEKVEACLAPAVPYAGD